jgi:ubiquinone/menaquinone biosynthesis C-methylase UbiE
MRSDNGCICGIGIGQEMRGEHVFGDISKKSPLSAFDLHNFHLELKNLTTIMADSNSKSHTGESCFGAEHFDKVAATYEDSRTSSPMNKIARDLISFAPPISSTSIVLDNASGPGIITGEILNQAASSAGGPPIIYAADISPAMIDILRKKNWPSVKSDVMDAQALSYPDNTFTHSFTNMGIFLFPEPEKGAAEIYRTLRPGGVAVITSIKQVGWVRIFQAAQKEVKPEAPLWKSPLKEEWSTDIKLRSVVQAGGFEPENIEIKTTESSMLSNTLVDFLASMRNSVTQMITKDWSEVEKRRFEVVLQEQIEKEMSNPRELEIVAWVAVARK